MTRSTLCSYVLLPRAAQGTISKDVQFPTLDYARHTSVCPVPLGFSSGAFYLFK